MSTAEIIWERGAGLMAGVSARGGRADVQDYSRSLAAPSLESLSASSFPAKPAWPGMCSCESERGGYVDHIN